jgi:hypothetical protein
MGYRFNFLENGSVLVVVFEGVISPEEEAQAIRDPAEDPQMKPNPKILVDRTRARMTMTSEHVWPQIELIRQHLAKLGEPTVAVVVDDDHDYGMLRMFELTAEEQIPHSFSVFRRVDDACQWLGLDPAMIVWP